MLRVMLMWRCPYQTLRLMSLPRNQVLIVAPSMLHELKKVWRRMGRMKTARKRLQIMKT